MPSARTVNQLLEKYPLISDQVDRQELAVILRELDNQLNRDTAAFAVVEFGCYIGTTSLFIRRLLDAYQSPGEFHVYDSFDGLPDKTNHDLSPAGEQFKTGELAVGRKAFQMQFKKAGLRLPIVHKGWFDELTDNAIPEHISFAYLDGDYYESIADSLRLITPRLLRSATVVVDDYVNEALPGAARAVDEWLQGRSARLRIESSLAIIHL